MANEEKGDKVWKTTSVGWSTTAPTTPELIREMVKVIDEQQRELEEIDAKFVMWMLSHNADPALGWRTLVCPSLRETRGLNTLPRCAMYHPLAPRGGVSIVFCPGLVPPPVRSEAFEHRRDFKQPPFDL